MSNEVAAPVETAAAATTATPHIPWTILRPGFWRCWLTIRRFKLFQNLILHHENWAGRVDTAPPLAKLIGKKAAKQNPVLAMEMKLNKLTLPVIYGMNAIAMPHQVTVKLPSGREQKMSLVGDFLLFPDEWHHTKYKILIQRLDATIGIYEHRMRQAVRDWFNPLYWLGCAVRVPETILEHAGMLRTAQERERFLHGYAWVVRILYLAALVIALAWLAAKLGLKLPWELLTKLLA
ncbi:MAG TPA: hypothetical protein VF123_09565 [Candidatus Sulfotelmatobacter sp.]